MKKEYKKIVGLLAFLVISFGVIPKLNFTNPIKIPGKVLAATTTMSPVNSAMGLGSVKTQVESLIAKNTDLQNEVQQLTLESKIRRVLKRGMSGEDVLVFQNTLNLAQADTAVPLSGHFGKTTEKALRTFQTQENIPSSGMLDAITLTHLNNAINENPADDGSQYDNLPQQIQDAASACSLADSPITDLNQDSSSTSPESTSTAQDNNSLAPDVCPVGCVAQDQIPECPAPADTTDSTPAPDTSTDVPVTIPAPVSNPTHTTTTPTTTLSTTKPIPSSTPITIIPKKTAASTIPKMIVTPPVITVPKTTSTSTHQTTTVLPKNVTH